MEAPPKGLQVDDFLKFLESHRESHYTRIDSKDYRCKTCGSQIMQVTCFVSIHDKGFSGCVGSGEVEKVPLPYCPKCEGEPKNISTCIHV